MLESSNGKQGGGGYKVLFVRRGAADAEDASQMPEPRPKT